MAEPALVVEHLSKRFGSHSIRLWAGAVVAALALGACGAGHTTRAPATGRPDVSFERAPGQPFGVVVTGAGDYAFVDLLQGRVLLYSTRSFPPHLIRSIRLPGEAVGSSLTRDGRLLLVADGQGATVVNVAGAERGSPNPVLGTLSPPPTAHMQASGAIETSSSSDGRYVFVSLEYGSPRGVIAVYRIGSTSAPRFGPADYVGAIALGSAVIGSALSPDGRYLYVTSELGGPAPGAAAQVAVQPGRDIRAPNQGGQSLASVGGRWDDNRDKRCHR